METRAPERSSGAAAPVNAFEDELDAFIDPTKQSPKFRAAYEDATRRHEILDKLVKCRKALKLSQTEVAKRMGVSQPTVSGFETESSDPHLSTLQRYARAVESTLSFRMDMPAHCDWLGQVERRAYSDGSGGGETIVAASAFLQNTWERWVEAARSGAVGHIEVDPSGYSVQAPAQEFVSA